MLLVQVPGDLVQDCLERGKGKGSVRINKLEEELCHLKDRGTKTEEGGKTEGSKNGLAQD